MNSHDQNPATPQTLSPKDKLVPYSFCLLPPTSLHSQCSPPLPAFMAICLTPRIPSNIPYQHKLRPLFPPMPHRATSQRPIIPALDTLIPLDTIIPFTSSATSRSNLEVVGTIHFEHVRLPHLTHTVRSLVGDRLLQRGTLWSRTESVFPFIYCISTVWFRPRKFDVIYLIPTLAFHNTGYIVPHRL